MAYDIFFRGEALPEEDVNQVKQHFAKLFKANDAKLAQLFSGKVITLKKQLSKEEALKYQQLFKKAGAKIYIKQSASAQPKQATPTKPATTPAATATPKPTAETPENSAQPQTVPTSSLQTLPVGSDVLSEAERQRLHSETVKVDTSGISLAAQGPLPQQQKPRVSTPDTSHLSASLSEQPLQTSKVEEKTVDTSAYTLAETGSRLLDYYDDIPTPLPKLEHISLAEPGSILVEPKKVDAKAPDTSHISLAPNN